MMIKNTRFTKKTRLQVRDKFVTHVTHLS